MVPQSITELRKHVGGRELVYFVPCYLPWPAFFSDQFWHSQALKCVFCYARINWISAQYFTHMYAMLQTPWKYGFRRITFSAILEHRKTLVLLSALSSPCPYPIGRTWRMWSTVPARLQILSRLRRNTHVLPTHGWLENYSFGFDKASCYLTSCRIIGNKSLTSDSSDVFKTWCPVRTRHVNEDSVNRAIRQRPLRIFCIIEAVRTFQMMLDPQIPSPTMTVTLNGTETKKAYKSKQDDFS